MKRGEEGEETHTLRAVCVKAERPAEDRNPEQRLPRLAFQNMRTPSINAFFLLFLSFSLRGGGGRGDTRGRFLRGFCVVYRSGGGNDGGNDGEREGTCAGQCDYVRLSDVGNREVRIVFPGRFGGQLKSGAVFDNCIHLNLVYVTFY